MGESLGVSVAVLVGVGVKVTQAPLAHCPGFPLSVQAVPFSSLKPSHEQPWVVAVV